MCVWQVQFSSFIIQDISLITSFIWPDVHATSQKYSFSKCLLNQYQ